MNTTPRTDALALTPMTRHDSDEFARQLERELNSLLASHERLRVALAFYADHRNWLLNGPFDGNGCDFSGYDTAEKALAAIPAEFRGAR